MSSTIIVTSVLKVVKTTAIVEINGNEMAVPTSMKGYRYIPGIGDVVRVRPYLDCVDIQKAKIVGIDKLVAGRLQSCQKRPQR